LRYFVFRSVALLVCLSASIALPISVQAQQQAAPAPSNAPSQQLQDAEGLLAQSNWKAASDKLNTYLAASPSDARALFDAGYAADAQNHPDDAAAFYRRSIAADNSMLEAHLSLGLLLARQNKLDEARTELQAATQLNAAENGPSFRARAWRALAQVDRESHRSAQAQP
jgi:tetratricopeptide (TPR) repeat protein